MWYIGDNVNPHHYYMMYPTKRELPIARPQDYDGFTATQLTHLRDMLLADLSLAERYAELQKPTTIPELKAHVAAIELELESRKGNGYQQLADQITEVVQAKLATFDPTQHGMLAWARKVAGEPPTVQQPESD